MEHTAWIIVTIWLALKWGFETWLESLNRRQVSAWLKSGEVTSELDGLMDRDKALKSGPYTLAKSRFSQWESLWDLAILLMALGLGWFPGWYDVMRSAWGDSVWAHASFMLVGMLGLSLFSIPWEYAFQFRLEEKFGFNQSTIKTWIADKIKTWILSLALGIPVIAFLLWIPRQSGEYWWVLAWIALTVIQLILMVLAPALILPLFNKFEPLPEGELKDRLLALGEKTGFNAKTILVMDGSRRSKHSNAFFTGFGRWKKIVLFDTLIDALEPIELEAVLAHEIGHYKKGHIPKSLIFSTLGAGIGFWILSLLAKSDAFYRAFGFESISESAPWITPAFFLFTLLSGAVTFWIQPLFNFWSRKNEYEADGYALNTMKAPEPLIGALKKLNEENLSNPTPHPWYSGFYYSHPTLLERIRFLKSQS